ncbi:hypothetical protein XAP6164_80006 [Xanthomonas phaseoli pv. phaseoli]|nr:hypothetical protein XAP6164_80006 [Xanthomonas phaseoli pv. phaseoli]
MGVGGFLQGFRLDSDHGRMSTLLNLSGIMPHATGPCKLFNFSQGRRWRCSRCLSPHGICCAACFTRRISTTPALANR